MPGFDPADNLPGNWSTPVTAVGSLRLQFPGDRDLEPLPTKIRFSQVADLLDSLGPDLVPPQAEA